LSNFLSHAIACLYILTKRQNNITKGEMQMAKKKEPIPLKKGASTFHLIGKAKIGDNAFSIDSESSSSDYIYSRANIGVDTGNGNVVYANLMGGYFAENDNVIYVHGKDEDDKDDYSNRFTVDWEDRFDEDILKSVGKGCFISVGIEKDSKKNTYVKKFLSAYDAIDYLNEYLTDGTVVSVRGNLQYQYYEGSVTVNKNITSIYITNVEPEKYCAKFEQTILLDSDSIGKLDKEKETYTIDAYVVDYVSKVDGEQIKKNVSFFKSFELEMNKDKPELTKRVLDKYFKVKKKDGIVELGVEGILQEGASIATANIDDLSDDLKDLVELGLMTEEEALAKCTDGKKERRMIITKPLVRKSDEDENVTVTIVRDEDKYTRDDLVFIESLINIDSEDDDSVVNENNYPDDDSNDLPFDLDDDVDEEDDLMALLMDD
jgi:hypothetical protein